MSIILRAEIIDYGPNKKLASLKTPAGLCQLPGFLFLSL
jgi:hypothetical protein